MRYLVTGGAGFIGFHLCRALLERGDSVVILDSLDDFYDPSLKVENVRYLSLLGARFVRGDAGDAEVFSQAARGVDGVFHLAGLAGVRRSFLERERYFAQNAETTARLGAIAAKIGVGAVVFASSSSVYGNAPTPFCEEQQGLEPLSPYGESKLLAEVLLRAQHSAFSLPVCSVRLFSVYGERMRPDLAARKFAGAILRGEVIDLFGDCSRDYTHASDAANGLALAMDYALKAGGCSVFNIAGGASYSTVQLVAELERALGARAHTRDVGAKFGDAKVTAAKLTKAKDALGYVPRTSFRDGIESFVGWLLG